MNILTVDNITKAYGERKLFAGQHKRLALVSVLLSPAEIHVLDA